jgi:hypothetical protein
MDLFFQVLVFVILSRSLRGWELKKGGGGGVEAWRAELGLALHLSQRKSRQKRRGVNPS